MSKSVPLYYSTQGIGKPVILLHGLFGAGENLGMVARALATEHQVISVDLRNHGRSPHSPVMDYPSMAADVAALITALDLSTCIVLGHSMGGKAAMQLALTRPELIARLIVADIAPIAYQLHHSDILEGLSRLNEKPVASRQEADRLLADFISDTGVRQFLLRNLQRREDKLFDLRLNLAALLANQQHIAAAVDGPSFHGPTLFIKGANSDYIQTEYRQRMYQLFPNHQLVTLKNAGHWLHAEQPAAFNRTVQGFLNN